MFEKLIICVLHTRIINFSNIALMAKDRVVINLQLFLGKGQHRRPFPKKSYR